MVVVTIIGVLAALAGPSFGPLIERWRVRQATEDLQGSLFLARAEAVKRGGRVTIVKTANDSMCTNATGDTNWGCGWTVFIDTNDNGAQDTGQTPNEDTLQVIAAPTRLNISLAKSNGYLKIDRWGIPDNSNGEAIEFQISPQSTGMSNAAALKLCIVAGGLIKQKKGSESC